MSNKYAKAYKEVLEIIKYFPEEEYNKIPKEEIVFYKENMDNDYEFTINPEIDLSDQNISKEANALIVSLFQDYFATEEQKEKIKKFLELNEKKADEEKREKYNPDNLFKNNNKFKNQGNTVAETIQETALIEYKDNFFTRFKSFILKLLHIG